MTQHFTSMTAYGTYDTFRAAGSMQWCQPAAVLNIYTSSI